MKRLGLVGALTALVVIALPGFAHGAKIKHAGALIDTPSATVKFALKERKGELVKITGMVFDQVPVSCSDGTEPTFEARLMPFNIDGTSFARTGPLAGSGFSDGTVQVAGRFNGRARRAKGDVRFGFQTTAGADCASESLLWRTSRR